MRKLLYAALPAVLIAIFVQTLLAATVATERAVRQTGMPAVASTMTTTQTVQILSVDHRMRTVAVKMPKGDVRVYRVDKDVRNLRQVKTGDILKTKEVQRLAIRAHKTMGKPTYKESYTMKRAPKGAKPSFVATDKVVITGKVQMVDYNKRTVAVTGPSGKTKTFQVAPDVRNLRKLKPGDLVVAEYTDTLSMFVESPKR